MIEGFDKEMDALLRKTRESEFAFAETPKSPHLDADTISAFAENALPAKSKQIYTAHIADCDRCRRILSNLILLNSEAETETASSFAAETPLVEAAVPWYQKLFFGRNLVFAMGALVAVFGVFTAFIVFQSKSGKNTEVSQISANKLATKGGPNADSEPMFANSNSAAAAPATNSASISTNSTSNTSISNPAASATPNLTMSNTSAKPVAKDSVSSERADAPEELRANSQTNPTVYATPPVDTDDESKENKNELSGLVRDQTLSRTKSKEPAAMPPPPSVSAAQSAPMPKKSVTELDKNKSDEKELSARKRAGGKTFRRENSIWIDDDYKQGTPLTDVLRGSNEYKKLDGGLKNIAAQFSGTVIIVWKSKGYRIQ